MSDNLQVDRDDIIAALREQISALAYENALLAAAVAKLQRASAAQSSGTTPPG